MVKPPKLVPVLQDFALAGCYLVLGASVAHAGRAGYLIAVALGLVLMLVATIERTLVRRHNRRRARSTW